MEKKFPPLWEHQKNAIELSQNMPELALFFEMGTGKTRTTIDILRHRFAANGRLLKTLIVCPKIILQNWKEEFLKYSRVSERDIVILTGSGDKRCKLLVEAAKGGGLTIERPKIFITNYEAFDEKMAKLYDLFWEYGFEAMVADEAHYIKNPESKRARRLVKLSDTVKNKYALTGTPILNTAMDVFMIFRFLDGGKTFGSNFWAFRSKWFEDENARFAGKQGYYPKFIPRPETYAAFTDLIYRKALRALKKDCLDLPPLVEETIHIELSKEQRKLYEEMKKQYVAYIDDLKGEGKPRAVVAQLAITKALRLMQILTGYCKTDEGEIYRIKENPRLDALSELLELHSPGHKIIVWSIYHENYADIAEVCRRHGIGYAELHGGIKDKDAQMRKFRSDPSCRVMIANQKAAGIGVNLVESDLSIYYSKNFSWGQDEQSESRNYRGGSEIHEKVTRIDLTVKGTMDELIAEALANKQNISERILDWRG